MTSITPADPFDLRRDGTASFERGANEPIAGLDKSMPDGEPDE